MRIKEGHKRSLTDAFVLGRSPPAKGMREERIYDGGPKGVPGLSVAFFPSGTRSYYFAYSRGRPKTMRLGHAPPLDIKTARAMAMEHGRKLLLDPNYDPLVERKALRGATKFTDLMRAYYADPENQAKKSSQETRRLIETHVEKKWGDLAADQITQSNAIALLKSFTQPYMKNHIKVLTGAIFNWALRPEQALVRSNPFANMKSVAANSRDRVVQDHEWSPMWSALDNLGLIRSSALKVAALTGQRSGEVTHMRREHLHGRWWQMPGKADKTGWKGTKNGRPHAVFLTAEVMRLIAEIDPDATTGFVFATVHGRPVKELAAGMARVSAAIGLGDGEDERIRPHDLRRSFATTMARLRYTDADIDRVLNHRSAEKNIKVRETYNRHDYAEEKREIMERVGAFIMRKSRAIVRTT